MGYLYICTLIFLGIAFIALKKSDEKLNLIKWICIFIVGILGYNITLCMILGILHITQNIWLLSLINIIIGAGFLYNSIRRHEIQKYKCSKLDIIAIFIILVFFAVMFVKDLYILNGDISHWAIDSAIHYRAAKHYSENLKLFMFAEDKTFFNFNIMQTGAYINDGIFMNVINSITGIEKIYIYQIFESLTMFISGIAMYTFFADKIKTKKGLIGSLILFGLYMYGYPYNSWIYGFSYLSVGIAMITLLLSIVEMLFSNDNIKKSIVISMIVIASMGLIFSYCLFVPAVFTAICIYVFLEELKDKNSKKYLKVFGKNTLIITILLLLVTAFGIGYLFIPSFIIEGQKNLVNALQENGGIYEEKYANFIPYIPFAIIFIYEFVKKFKEKEIKFLDIIAIILTGYLALLYIGMMFEKVSPYYMLKVYFAEWIIIFAVVIDILNNNIDKKIFRLDIIILVALFMIFEIKQVGINTDELRAQPAGIKQIIILQTSAKYYLILLLALFTTLPEILKSIDFSKIRFLPKKLKLNIELKSIKITPFSYVVAVCVLVCSWTWLKAGHIIGEEEKHALPNLIGIYYFENCERRKALDVMQNFNENNILITKYARENLKDITADNTILITEGGPSGSYRTMWAIATLEYKSDSITFRDVMKKTNKYNLQDALENPSIKYIIRLDPKDKERMEACSEDIEEVFKNENAEILYSNENGFVAKVDR